MEAVRSVLFLCTGNLCRSPMAEAILKDLLERAGMNTVRVSSAGTWGLEGERAAPYAEEVCASKGIDLSGHVARRLNREMIEQSDLIVVMEMGHLQAVLDLVPNALAKTRLLAEFGTGRSRPDEEIPDPYGGPKGAYRRCFERIEGHVKVLAQEIVRAWGAGKGAGEQ